MKLSAVKLSAKRARVGAITVALLACGQAALAHHSFGMFDMQKTLTIEGTVKDFQWTNPHVWIDLEILDPVTHQPAVCSIEANSVSIQERMGWSRTSLKPGDKVSVQIHPLRTNQSGGSLVSASVNGVPIGHPFDHN